MKQLDHDTLAYGHFTNLMNIALKHNAAVVELATNVLATGPLEKKSRRQVFDNFKKLHKQANDEYLQATEQFEKDLQRMESDNG